MALVIGKWKELENVDRTHVQWQASSTKNVNLVFSSIFQQVCQANSALEPVKYSWLKNGRPFHLDNEFGSQVFRESPFDGNIIFVSPRSQDVGTYQVPIGWLGLYRERLSKHIVANLGRV